MQLLNMQVTPEAPGMETYLVEFIGEGGEAISVALKDNSDDQSFTRDALILKAKAMMVQLSNMFDDVSAQFKDVSGGYESDAVDVPEADTVILGNFKSPSS